MKTLPLFSCTATDTLPFLAAERQKERERERVIEKLVILIVACGVNMKLNAYMMMMIDDDDASVTLSWQLLGVDRSRNLHSVHLAVYE
ncbi:hypothetical protein VNO77_01785 [Canavalia gladiata]|uniref:Uncharacterized protein n=1 Tax=Canavalia gladiata TaxID=3824 RepID=A0AAN9MRV4_CANGL